MLHHLQRAGLAHAPAIGFKPRLQVDAFDALHQQVIASAEGASSGEKGEGAVFDRGQCRAFALEAAYGGGAQHVFVGQDFHRQVLFDDAILDSKDLAHRTCPEDSGDAEIGIDQRACGQRGDMDAWRARCDLETAIGCGAYRRLGEGALDPARGGGWRADDIHGPMQEAAAFLLIRCPLVLKQVFKFGDELTVTGKTVCGIFAEAASDTLGDVRRTIPHHRAQIRRRLRAVFHQNLDRRAGGEGRLPGHHPKQRRAQCVDIGVEG